MHLALQQLCSPLVALLLTEHKLSSNPCKQVWFSKPCIWYLPTYLPISIYINELVFLGVFVYLFILFCFLVNGYNLLCNDCAPKYRCFSNVLTNRIESGHCWKIASLVLHDMSITTIRWSICLLVTVLHCWIIFNFSSIISSLVSQSTFVFISSHSIDFRLFLLLISNHILIISSEQGFVYLNIIKW